MVVKPLAADASDWSRLDAGELWLVDGCRRTKFVCPGVLTLYLSKLNQWNRSFNKWESSRCVKEPFKTFIETETVKQLLKSSGYQENWTLSSSADTQQFSWFHCSQVENNDEEDGKTSPNLHRRNFLKFSIQNILSASARQDTLEDEDDDEEEREAGRDPAVRIVRPLVTNW